MIASRLTPDTIAALYTEHIATLQEGYATALENAGFDAVVIHSGHAVRRSRFDDQFWPHKPTPAFAHWSPFGRPGAAVLIQPGKRPMLFYMVAEDFWENEMQPATDHFWSSFDEHEVSDLRSVSDFFPGGRVAFIGDTREPAAPWGIADGATNPEALLRGLDPVRAHKTAYERACIAEANRRGALGHVAVAEAFASGDHAELDLHLLFLRTTRQDDSQTPYKNIVAMDENAATLHHVCYDDQPPMHKNQSLLLDAGATFYGYCSDITRTVMKGKSGEAAATFAALISSVEELQAEVCRRVRPGLEFEDLNDRAHELLAGVLRQTGISSASQDELVESGATRCFLPHGLGHALGIQVHDVGCRPREPRPENPYLRNTSVIASGHVVTIEPGCYFIDAMMQKLRAMPIARAMDWDLIDALTHFGGVRIEDNIAVLDSETANLTRDNWPSTP